MRNRTSIIMFFWIVVAMLMMLAAAEARAFSRCSAEEGLTCADLVHGDGTYAGFVVRLTTGLSPDGYYSLLNYEIQEDPAMNVQDMSHFDAEVKIGQLASSDPQHHDVVFTQINGEPRDYAPDVFRSGRGESALDFLEWIPSDVVKVGTTGEGPTTATIGIDGIVFVEPGYVAVKAGKEMLVGEIGVAGWEGEEFVTFSIARELLLTSANGYSFKILCTPDGVCTPAEEGCGLPDGTWKDCNTANLEDFLAVVGKGSQYDVTQLSTAFALVSPIVGDDESTASGWCCIGRICLYP